jgi:tetratricopeptide (TPR) repeat protein
MEDLKDRVGLLRERIKCSREDKALYRELSDLLFQAGKISAAMNILEKSLEHDLESTRMGEAHSAEPSLKTFAEPPAPAGREGKWHFDRGLEFADAYLYEDAIDCFQQALESGQDTFETHYCLAGVHKSLGNLAESERHCRRSLELNARFAPGYILLGALLKRPGGLEESIAVCKKALLLDPDCVAAYYDLACYYSLLGKREQAMASMEMALCKGFCDFEWLLRDPDLAGVRANPEFQLLLRSYSKKSL